MKHESTSSSGMLLGMAAGAALDNRIKPEALNPLDARILRESFRQAQRLQQVLALKYQL